MKTRLIFLSIITITTLTLISLCCIACTNPSEYTYKIHDNKEILEHCNFNLNGYSDYWAEVVDGDMLVFEYIYKASEDPMTYDDGHTEKVMFQINKDELSFLFENKEIITTKCFIYEAYDWADYYKVSDGIIEGTKLNENEWQVKFDVFVIDESGTEFRVTVDHVFTK